MLDSRGFDLWADGYDKSVQLSEHSNTYPFAGYREVLGSIYRTVRANPGRKVLDIGFGTGILTQKLYEDGYRVYGMDFSENMIRIAKEKMPGAFLIQHDFTRGFPEAFAEGTFDFILCTYAIHHLNTQQKLSFIRQLQAHLNPSGQILIGDVAFETEEELARCRAQSGDGWDEDEIYPVAETLKQGNLKLEFLKISFCSGVISIKK